MEGHLSAATIEVLNRIVRTCRNMRHVIGRNRHQPPTSRAHVFGEILAMVR
jgi:hypothetical protein